MRVHRFREWVVHHERRNKAGKETGLEEESEKTVKGNGKRETRGRGRRREREAEGLKSINFKSQSRRLTVITLVAEYLCLAYVPSEETKGLALEQSMLLGPRRAAKARGRGEPRRGRKGSKVRGTPQKRLMLFDFRIRDKLRNSQGARCYRARIVKLFRPPVYVCGSFRTTGNARLSTSRRRSRDL